MKGKIIRGVGGFYDVHTPDNLIYRCRAKGIFRRLGIKPLVGDDVDISITDPKDMEGNVDAILERKNFLIRPAVANVDQAIVIFSITAPAPNVNLLDHFLVNMHMQGLPCIICFNKNDLLDDDMRSLSVEIYKSYRDAGYQVIEASVVKESGLSSLREVLKGHTSTVAGPSGVGKSSIINALRGFEVMETGEISRKIQRGKHTTRHSELIYIGDESFIMDTPGFTSLHLPDMDEADLTASYVEFADHEGSCRFNGCSHTHEPDCGIKRAVEEGNISKMRYDTYCQLYEELSFKNRRG